MFNPLGLLFSALGLLKRLIEGAVDLIRRYPLQAALIAALALSWHLWSGREHARADLRKERVARQIDRDSYIAAQREAQRLAEAQRAANQATFHRRKETADAKQDIAVADDLGRAREWMRQHQAPSCPGSRAPASGQGGVAGGPDGANRPAVVVPAPDIETCTSNTRRLMIAQEWAMGLVADGLATTEAPAPPAPQHRTGDAQSDTRD